MNIIPATPPICLTSETNYLLIVDTYSEISKIYSMEIITTKQVMDKLGIFQYRF